MDKTFLTSLAASLHVAGLQDEDLSLVSQPSLGDRESRWVEDVAQYALELDNYWGRRTEQGRAETKREFKAPLRFSDFKPIGEGGMSVVYSAFDETTKETVAIKAGNSLRENSEFIKREFRALAKIRHPNLVVLKELHQFDDSIFFTMEYVRGESFNSKSVTKKTDGTRWQPKPLAELCARLLQLVDGIAFLHRMEFVHCDIKPSNILVTQGGRVVVLDLGLAQSTNRRQRTHAFGGTSVYMSPEQASGEPPQFATDWYAFGIVMFETLFGYRPFQGVPIDVLFDKLAGNVIAPSLEDTGVPDSLSRLCLSLLSPSPADRPLVEDIRRCLEGFSKQPTASIKSSSPETVFFGRQRELTSLNHALEDSANASEPTLLFIEGESGIGKTHLVQKFLENLHDSSDVIVLSGRCYENERIPYKAIDAVIGEIAVQWREHGQSDIISAELVNSINAVFKGFSRVGGQPDASLGIPLPQAVADGLNAILVALASQDKRVIVFIDDIQWADSDSGELLSKMIRGIPLLLICSHRPMEQANEFLSHLTDDVATRANANSTLRRVKVNPFSDRDAEQFLERSFPDVSKQVLDRTIEASEGVPMFLTSLAQQICTMPVGQIESNALDWTRDLEPEPKRLLEFVCASGFPLPQAIALEAAQISQDCDAIVSVLCSRGLVTLCQTNDKVTLNPFHDMIRESIYSGLNASKRRAVHSSIATVSENMRGVPPDRLAFHFREAGVPEKYCHYSILSGDVAVKSQAFDEAIRAYSEALENFVGDSLQKRALKEKLASSLGRQGRSSNAGDVYFELAYGKNEGPQFLQLAAYQYCVAGRIEDALKAFNRLLEPWGYTTFQSETSVLWRLVWLRLKLKVSETTDKLSSWSLRIGRTARIRKASDTDSEVAIARIAGHANMDAASDRHGNTVELVRGAPLCDLLWDIGIALSFFDTMQSCLFIHYSHQVAVQECDETRILRANIWRASYEAMFGIAKEKLVKQLLDSSSTPTTKRTSYLAGLHLLSSGMSAHCLGDWGVAFEKCAEAEKYLTANFEESEGCEAENTVYLNQMGIGAAQLFGMFGLQYSGQFNAMTERYHDLLAAPANREHLLNTSNLMIFIGPYVSLAADNPTEAFSSLAEALKMWPVNKLCFQHLVAEYARTEVYLYADDYRAAFDAMEKLWRTTSRSNYLYFEIMRVLCLELRGRCATTQFQTSNGRVAERIAHRAIAKLEREKVGWARPMAQKVRAGVELQKQNNKAAEIALLAARDGFEQFKMQHYQYAAEAKLCEIAGEMKTKRFQKVQDWFAQQGIKNQQAFKNMHYPM